MRLAGTLRSWNDEKGYGFIAPTHGGAELFVHISALPRDGTRPTPGEALTYELGRGKNGRPQAVNVLRSAVGHPSAAKQHTRPVRSGSTSGWRRVIAGLLVMALGVYGYGQYEKRLARVTAAEHDPAPQSAPAAALAAEPQAFRCDGRTHCSQMTSCSEAKYFLKNCPGTQMDGNHDGVPCEQQWCTSPWAK
ncbi:MAG TPA: cold shock domain-containing protein [Burkholderiaceae bacterium]